MFPLKNDFLHYICSKLLGSVIGLAFLSNQLFNFVHLFKSKNNKCLLLVTLLVEFWIQIQNTPFDSITFGFLRLNSYLTLSIFWPNVSSDIKNVMLQIKHHFELQNHKWTNLIQKIMLTKQTQKLCFFFSLSPAIGKS